MSVQKWILVTGAAGGLGQSVAARMAAQGWSVAVTGRDAARLGAAFGDRHLQIVADCSTEAGVRETFGLLEAHGVVPEGLAHCIGNIRLGALHRMRAADIEDCLRANLFSALHVLAGFTGALREAKRGGAAVCVSSAAAAIGTPNHEAVAAAKAGLEGLVRSAAATYAPAGIRINAVAPGLFETPASASLIATPPAREAAARQYPLPGIGNAGEVADLMAWLLSDQAARVTGQVWAVDGGFSRIRPLVK